MWCGVVGGVPGADRCVWSVLEAAGVKEMLVFSIRSVLVWNTAI